MNRLIRIALLVPVWSWQPVYRCRPWRGGQCRRWPSSSRPKARARRQAVNTLLAHHADVRARRQRRFYRALAWAVMRDNGAVVTALLNAKADPNQLDANHVTPFMLAIDNGDPQLVRQLLAARADPNLARIGGDMTPLMLAVHYGASDIVRQLLDAHADVNAREESFGQTALMMAAGHPDLVRLLLDHHADLTPVTKSWNITTTIFTPVTITLGVTGIPWNNNGDYLAKAGSYNALMFAVQAGDLESARMLLDAGMDVNVAAADGTTPLLTALYNWRYMQKANDGAARFGSRGTLQFASNAALANLLLDRGAKVKVVDAAGYTPLHGAVLGMMPDLGLGQMSFIKAFKAPDPEHEADSLALVQRLLAAGADPNLATAYPTGGAVGAVRINPLPPGSTPFHAAAMVKSAKLADMLAAAGGDPNRLRQDGHTPFSIAAKYDNLPAVQSMVAHGADLKKTYNDADQIPDPVLSKTEPRKNQTILHIAASGGAGAVGEYLIHHGVPAGAKNDHGETALQLADEQELFRWRYIKEGAGGIGPGQQRAQLRRHQWYVQAGPGPEGAGRQQDGGQQRCAARRDEGQAMIHTRQYLLRVALLGSVLAGGLSLSALAADNGQALINAAQDGLDGKVSTLLAHHADVRAVDSAGSTALAWAVMRGNGAVVEALLKAKADPNQLDANHVTPFMLAIDNGDPQLVRQLLAAGADPNLARNGGETPLMLAVHYGAGDIVRQLLDAHADVNAREEKFGQTALMMAAGHHDLVRMLLDHHADLTPVTKSWNITTTIFTPTTTTLGVTGIPWNNKGDYTARQGSYNALMFAVQAGDMESVRMLLDAGMDVNVAVADGTTPLLAALYNWRYAGSRHPPTARFGSRGILEFASNTAIANLLLDRGARVKVVDAAGCAAAWRGAGHAGGFRSHIQRPPGPQSAGGGARGREPDAGAPPVGGGSRSQPADVLYPTGGPVGDVRVNFAAARLDAFPCCRPGEQRRAGRPDGGAWRRSQPPAPGWPHAFHRRRKVRQPARGAVDDRPWRRPEETV